MKKGFFLLLENFLEDIDSWKTQVSGWEIVTSTIIFPNFIHACTKNWMKRMILMISILTQYELAPKFLCWKWWQTILKIKVSSSQQEGSTFIPKILLLLLLLFYFSFWVLRWWVGGRGVCVPIKFPKGSSSVPQDIPNNTSKHMCIWYVP